MSSPICYVNWLDKNLDKYQGQQVPLVKFYDDGKHVEIVYKREFKTVPKDEVEWVRWE